MAGGVPTRKFHQRRMIMLESVFHVIDARFLAVFRVDLDDIEAPRQVTGAELLEPGVCSALDECLLGLVYRVQRPDSGAFLAGFHLHKQEQPVVPCNDVHLAFAGSSEIPRQDPASLGTQPIGSHAFTVIAQPRPAARGAVRLRQVAGRVEPPAETSDDDGDKGRDSEALQDGLSCHIPDVSQSHIGETRGRLRA